MQKEFPNVLLLFLSGAFLPAIKLFEAIHYDPSESIQEWLLNAFRNAGERNHKNRAYPIWKLGNHPIEFRSKKMINHRMNSFHNVPVEQGILVISQDHPWSSISFIYGSCVKGIKIVNTFILKS